MKKEDITRFIGYQLSHEDQAIREPVRNLKGITLRTSLLPLFLDLLKENTSLLVKTENNFKILLKSQTFFSSLFCALCGTARVFFFKKTD